MIFGLLSVARMVGPPKFPGAIPASEVQATPVHKPVALVIAGISVVVIVAGMASGLNNGLLTLCIVIFPLLILGSLFVKGVQEHAGKHQSISHIPSAPTREDALRTGQGLRQGAEELSGGILPPSRPPGAPERAPGRAATARSQVADADLDERMLRVAAILIAPCPACGAEGATFCKPVGSHRADDPVLYLLDHDREIVAHDARIGNAVKTGTARIADVAAQFGSHVPVDLWKEIL